jgi:hypothetical protein
MWEDVSYVRALDAHQLALAQAHVSRVRRNLRALHAQLRPHRRHAAKQKAANGGGLSQQTGDTVLTTAAVLFIFCRLVVAAFTFMGIRGLLFSGRLSHLWCRRHRNLGGLGFGRAATA